MSRTGHRIFRHPIAWFEIARHKIRCLSWRRDRNNGWMEQLQPRKIWAQVLDDRFVFKDNDINIVYLEYLRRMSLRSERLGQILRESSWTLGV